MQEDEMEAAFGTGRKSWPGVQLSWQMFVARVETCGVKGNVLAERAADLFLAAGCANGDVQAIKYLESEILSQVDLYVARFSLPPGGLDEVRQRLRVKLLVGESAAIRCYRARGPLGGWVRMIAVRTALDVIAAEGGQVSADTDLLDFTVGTADNPELATAKNLYRARFNAALEAGLEALCSRDRTLLRLLIIDGLNIDAIGTIYHVHRATVARWFVAIRSKMINSLRSELNLRATPSPSEMRSLIVLLRDELYVSADRMLASATRP